MDKRYMVTLTLLVPVYAESAALAEYEARDRLRQEDARSFINDVEVEVWPDLYDMTTTKGEDK